jgi:hypothetical protein
MLPRTSTRSARPTGATADPPSLDRPARCRPGWLVDEDGRAGSSQKNAHTQGSGPQAAHPLGCRILAWLEHEIEILANLVNLPLDRRSGGYVLQATPTCCETAGAFRKPRGPRF